MYKSNRKSKYNNQKIYIDGFKFDSKEEGKYYLHLKELKEKGIIKKFNLQPKFELQPKFKDKDGNNHRNISYILDFEVFYADGLYEVVDVKGQATSEAKIKRKMFIYKHPNIEIKWLCYVKKRGGWICYFENQKMIEAEKKEKKVIFL